MKGSYYFLKVFIVMGVITLLRFTVFKDGSEQRNPIIIESDEDVSKKIVRKMLESPEMRVLYKESLQAEWEKFNSNLPPLQEDDRASGASSEAIGNKSPHGKASSDNVSSVQAETVVDKPATKKALSEMSDEERWAVLGRLSLDDPKTVEALKKSGLVGEYPEITQAKGIQPAQSATETSEVDEY